ncbi:LysR family transcriptional regulator [Streptomyces luteolus]|uniref:LysR family transcriptional regulator n=1 Tax=Streptomyces luteolus TaxID=3043615 RepID=A0ABT6STB1_9ACTN|nr:LysR family transcriptional regulator [Streptomyces sp. B-S-A12]MDI3418844.1 LysR family transcriptional regulator [Streptomyces sp. B-S-A12]
MSDRRDEGTAAGVTGAANGWGNGTGDSAGDARLAHRVPELGALQLLLAVARLGSLGRAAAELGISQPAASNRIRAMERQLGVGLVERSPRGSRLTDVGVLVTDWARRVVEAAEAFDAGAQALRDRRDSRLRVAASMTVAEYLMPGWLIALRRERPDTAVSLLSGNSAAVVERLLADEADLGFVEGLTAPRGLRGAVVARDRLVVVVGPDHPWARRRAPLAPAELAATGLILREEGSGTREVLDAALAEHGGLAAPLLELTSTTALKAAVASGAGPAVLSELAVAEELAAHRLIQIPVEGVDLRRALRAVWRSGQRPTGPGRDLLSLTRRAQ